MLTDSSIAANIMVSKGESDAMRFKRLMIIWGSCVLITGCTGKDIREGVCQGMYEGARIENRKELSPGDRSANPDMDYNQYKNVRKGRVDENR
jgi:hypothetical protein